MASIGIVSRIGSVIDVTYREIQIGTKGKLKNKKFVVYNKKRYIVEPRFLHTTLYPKAEFYIYPWGV